jgi:hypothetical protein
MIRSLLPEAWDRVRIEMKSQLSDEVWLRLKIGTGPEMWKEFSGPASSSRLGL